MHAEIRVKQIWSIHPYLSTSVPLTETTETQAIVSLTANAATFLIVTPALLLCRTHIIILNLRLGYFILLLNIILWFPDTL